MSKERDYYEEGRRAFNRQEGAPKNPYLAGRPKRDYDRGVRDAYRDLMDRRNAGANPQQIGLFEAGI